MYGQKLDISFNIFKLIFYQDMKHSEKLRQIIAGNEILVLPGVYDCLSAMIAEKTGFSALFTSGFGIAASGFGKPDYGIVSSSEMIESICRIADSVSVPLVADIDNGYGNYLNVIRTINQLLKYDIAGIILEDQKWPKRCGHMDGKQVIETSEHAEKIKAARSVDKDLVVIARTDSRAVHGLDEAIERGKIYLEAGADILFIEAPQSEEELNIIADAFPENYLFANMVEGGKTPVLSTRELEKIGFKIVVYPLTGLFAAANSLKNIFLDLKNSGSSPENDDKISFKEFEDIIDLDNYKSF